MTLPIRPTVPGLSGDRFRVIYALTGNKSEAEASARNICVEQTIEFPYDLAPEGDIRDHIVGQLEDLQPMDDGRFAATISYAVETAGRELTQFLNVVFGNTSIKAGVRVERLELPASLLAHYRGPRFGEQGWRELLHVPDRPLLATALKPMGLSAQALADIAYQFALGGMDIIKDDHGLMDQEFSPYQERLERCAEAVAKANQETGGHSVYMPQVTAPAHEVIDRARSARQAGAGALMVCPGLTGWDTMRQIADDDSIGLPIMSHPAFTGSFVTSPDNGISHYALYGQMQRLAGADASIYPNFGGRFSFSKDECRSIVAGCQADMGHIKPILAAPGGGMNMESIPEMREVYGQRVIYLVGGGMHRHSDNLVENVRYFRSLIEG